MLEHILDIDLRGELMKALEETKKAKERETIATSELGKAFLQYQKTCSAYQKIYIQNCQMRHKLFECGQDEFLNSMEAQ